jgi:DNA-binding MarR family transcriptional regulator
LFRFQQLRWSGFYFNYLGFNYLGQSLGGDVRWLTADEQVAWRLLLRVAVGLPDRLEAELQAAHGLSLSEYEVLAHLSSYPDRRLRMRDLAGSALLSKSRLSHTVDRLEGRGLVRRRRCEHDRRGAFAELTAEGFTYLEAAAPTHVTGVRRHFNDCVPAADLDAFVRVLRCVADTLSSEEHGPAPAP